MSEEQPGGRHRVDPSLDPIPGVAGHAAPEGAPLDSRIDLSRDPNPGKADHGLPDHED